jgi:long-chain acyl-CoA synthetase
MTEPSIAHGPSIEGIAHLCRGRRVDDLLSRAAAAAPDRPALRTPTDELTFGRLDARVTRFAAALRTLLGSRRTVVAVAGVLDPAFAVAFYGTSRAGMVTAVVNPLLREDVLAHVLSTAKAELLVAPPEMHDRVTGVRTLREIVLTRPDPRHPGMATVDDLVAGGTDPVPRSGDPDAPACLLFTSGTTGAPKGARLTHRNLLVNAAQVVVAHRLDVGSVLFNHLPTFHLMHLDIGMAVGATHVLFPDDDFQAAAAVARSTGATHLYSLPVRLARLASRPDLCEIVIPSLRAVLSGGSALSVPHASALAAHFGVPVVQGYGLAETSPCTHPGTVDGAPDGSCGPLAAGTSCRIVDIDTERVVPLGRLGEIRVRGPQLMAGYAGRDLSADLDADGWFPTGDLGRLDAAGNLFLVDRLKDVFKRDNWLVAPARIEGILRGHPDVVDCVVLDVPDEFSGAVAHALVVPARANADPVAIGEFVNTRVPYYERVEHVRLVSAIPRSPNGKVTRGELRALLVTDAAPSG